MPTQAIPAPEVSIRREFDAAPLNAVVNHPAVHPHVALPGQGALDLSELIADHRNIALACDGGVMVCVQHEPGIYEVHSQFLPHARGAYALAAVRQAIHGMFLEGDAMELLTKVPEGNRRAEALTLRAGFRHEFDRADAWVWRGETVALRHYALRYADYVSHYADDLATHGAAFHTHLDREKARVGIGADSHPDDPAHDVNVGAAAQMIRAGKVAKAVALYNRWARFAGYQTIAAVSLNPTVLNIGDCFIEADGDSFKVLPCQ